MIKRETLRTNPQSCLSSMMLQQSCCASACERAANVTGCMRQCSPCMSTALSRCSNRIHTYLLRRFWANMYLAQFYDDAVSASRHPSIAIDSGFMAVSQGAYNYDPVGDTGEAILGVTPRQLLTGCRLSVTYSQRHPHACRLKTGC